jgi:hypothetical protein
VYQVDLAGQDCGVHRDPNVLLPVVELDERALVPPAGAGFEIENLSRPSNVAELSWNSKDDNMTHDESLDVLVSRLEDIGREITERDWTRVLDNFNDISTRASMIMRSRCFSNKKIVFRSCARVWGAVD